MFEQGEKREQVNTYATVEQAGLTLSMLEDLLEKEGAQYLEKDFPYNGNVYLLTAGSEILRNSKHYFAWDKCEIAYSMPEIITKDWSTPRSLEVDLFKYEAGKTEAALTIEIVEGKVPNRQDSTKLQQSFEWGIENPDQFRDGLLIHEAERIVSTSIPDPTAYEQQIPEVETIFLTSSELEDIKTIVTHALYSVHN
jgi:hypothetical protein